MVCDLFNRSNDFTTDPLGFFYETNDFLHPTEHKRHCSPVKNLWIVQKPVFLVQGRYIREMQTFDRHSDVMYIGFNKSVRAAVNIRKHGKYSSHLMFKSGDR